MINLTQEMYSPPERGSAAAKFRVGERTAKCANAADRPERHDRETRSANPRLETPGW